MLNEVFVELNLVVEVCFKHYGNTDQEPLILTGDVRKSYREELIIDLRPKGRSLWVDQSEKKM